MRTSPPFRICTTCDAPDHFEDCKGCFGFGVERDGGRAINAGDAENPPPWRPCLTCRSTPAGIPGDVTPWKFTANFHCEGCGAEFAVRWVYSEAPHETLLFQGLPCPGCSATYTIECSPPARDAETFC